MTTIEGLEWDQVFLPFEGGRLAAFHRGGEADRAPAVLLHGAGANARAWAPIVAAFGDRPLLLFDMPGHGLSPTPGSWDLHATAGVIAEATRRFLGDVPIFWGGHSWGGKIAGLLAAGQPQLARGLLLFDPSPSSAVPVDIDEFVDDIWKNEMAPQATQEDAVKVAQSLAHWQPRTPETAAAIRHGLAQHQNGSWSLRPTRSDLVALATHVLHRDASETLLQAAGVPTLLLIASESEAWQQFTNRQVYTRATTVVVAGNHWIHRCNPRDTSAAMGAWLERHGERPGSTVGKEPL